MINVNTIKDWWSTFLYNYGWSDWVKYIDGWIPKFALFVPIFGYLILFNDEVSKILIFKELTNESVINSGLNSIQRLRLLYFGLIFLGLSNLIYRIKKPYQFRFGTNVIDYTKTCLDIYTRSDYIDIHGDIQHDGHFTKYGKYSTKDWENFMKMSIRSTPIEEDTSIHRYGMHVVDIPEEKYYNNWENAKNSYQDLLKGMLFENFFRHNIGQRVWLTLCILLSTLGYLFLAMPSLDIFIKVLKSTF